MMFQYEQLFGKMLEPTHIRDKAGFYLKVFRANRELTNEDLAKICGYLVPLDEVKTLFRGGKSTPSQQFHGIRYYLEQKLKDKGVDLALWSVERKDVNYRVLVPINGRFDGVIRILSKRKESERIQNLKDAQIHHANTSPKVARKLVKKATIARQNKGKIRSLLEGMTVKVRELQVVGAETLQSLLPSGEK